MTLLFLGYYINQEIFQQSEKTTIEHEDQINVTTSEPEYEVDVTKQLDEMGLEYTAYKETTVLDLSEGIAIDKVIPGVGVNGLKIGTTISRAIAMLGTPTDTLSREEQVADWLQLNASDTLQIFSYYLDFDQVYEFRDKNRYAISKLYCRNNSVVLIRFTAFFGDLTSTKLSMPLVNGVVDFYQDFNTVFQAQQGDPFIFEEKPDSLLQAFGLQKDLKKDLYYFDKGVNYYFAESELIGYHIYDASKLDPKIPEQFIENNE